ncbi:MAG: hypothetical protein NTZ42_02270 [Candidatus Gribaldobacteria bacterium]|nr:hypothetical protein [Candidatus Gribaldobacteria bacterium]
MLEIINKIKRIRFNKKTLLISVATIAVVGLAMASYFYINQHNIQKALSDFNNFKFEVPLALLNADNLSLNNLAPSDLQQNDWQPQITVDTNIVPESDFMVTVPEISLKTPDVKWAPNEAICEQFQNYTSCDQAPMSTRDVCLRCPKKK